MLSKALDRSNRTNAVICFQSIDYSTVSDIKMFNDSVERNFLLLLRWFVSHFSSSKYVIIWPWFNAMHLHTFEAAGKSDTRQLLLVAFSGSPSFKSGMTSDSFQQLGKTDDIRERFTISVRVGKMHGSMSLITAIETL